MAPKTLLVLLTTFALALASPAGKHGSTSSKTTTSTTSTKTTSTTSTKTTSSTTFTTTTSSTTTTSTTSSYTSATATSVCKSYYALNQLARFDNQASVTGTLLTNSPQGIYDDLMFNGMGTVDITLTTVGVVAQSAPDVVAFGPLIAATILQGTPALTTVYTDSTIAFFDFSYFYFGCVLASQNNEASVPQSCNVIVTGLDTNGNTVASQTFNFVANGLQQQMIQATLDSGFVNLQMATFEVLGTGAVPSNATLAVLADNFDYTVYSIGIITA